MCQENAFPTVQYGHGDAETGTDILHGMQMEEVFRQRPQDEEKAVCRVRDDNVREDGMGMAAACAADPQDAYLPIGRLSMHEVSHGTHVGAVEDAVSFGSTPWADLIFP